jgi:hypothetical protein
MSLHFQICFAVLIHFAVTGVLMFIATKLWAENYRNSSKKMQIIHLPVALLDCLHLTLCIVSSNFENPVLKSRCFRMQLFCIALNSGDESPLDHYYHAGWRDPSRDRWSLSRVIATVKITTRKPIWPPYYSSEHCISPREYEHNVVLKISYASHSREHKILCMTQKYVTEFLALVLVLRSLLSIKERFVIELIPLALTRRIFIV